MDKMAEKELPEFKSADEMTEDELLDECFLDCDQKKTLSEDTTMESIEKVETKQTSKEDTPTTEDIEEQNVETVNDKSDVKDVEKSSDIESSGEKLSNTDKNGTSSESELEQKKVEA